MPKVLQCPADHPEPGVHLVPAVTPRIADRESPIDVNLGRVTCDEAATHIGVGVLDHDIATHRPQSTSQANMS